MATLMLSEVPSMWPKEYTPLPAPLDEDIDALDSTAGHTGNNISLAQQQPSRPTTSAASSSFFRRQGGLGGGGQGLVKGLRVQVGEEREEIMPFDQELPHALEEMLATDKGIDMALAERPLDLGPALWHAKLTEDLLACIRKSTLYSGFI